MTQQRRTGFTLIELIIVIVVIAVIAAILVPTINTILADGRIGMIHASVGSMKAAVAKYNGDTYRFPTDLLDFMRRPDNVAGNWKGPYLDSYPENPFKNNAISDWRLTPDPTAHACVSLEPLFGWAWFMDELGATTVFDRVEDALDEGPGRHGTGTDCGLVQSIPNDKRNVWLIIAWPTDAQGNPL